MLKMRMFLQVLIVLGLSHYVKMASACGNLTDPANGHVSAPITTVNATATYGCDAGYVLTGSDTRICLSSHSWSGLEPSCEKAHEYEHYVGKDCPGNNIGTYTVGNEKLCADRCTSDDLCAAFVPAGTSCTTKHTCDSAALVSSDQDIFVKKNIYFYDKYAYKDCGGHDLDYKEGLSEEGCADACHSNKRCESVHFIASTPKKCWLKWKCDVNHLYGNEGDQYIRKAITRYTRRMDVDCAGNDLQQYTTDLNTCAQDCSKRLDCRAIVREPSNNTCTLKSKCDDFVSTNGVIVYEHKERLDIPGYERRANLNCWWNDLRAYHTDVQSCADDCKGRRLCVAVMVRPSDDMCYLKSKCNHLVHNDGLVPYVMTGTFALTKFDEKMNTDCAGNEIASYAAAKDDCARDCYGNGQCVAFVSDDNTCQLKDKCDVWTNTSGVAAYVYKDSEVLQQFTETVGVDCEGNDLDNYTAGVGDCARGCMGRDDCVGFVLNPSTNWCWLKKKCDVMNNNSAVKTYVYRGIDRFDQIEGVDCYGNDLASYPAALVDCASDCIRRDGCVAFLVKPSTNQCWLKKRCDSNSFSDNSDLNLYRYKDTLALNRFDKRASIDCDGNDLSTYTASVADCARGCIGRYNCVGFMVRPSDNQCWLKKRCEPHITRGDMDAYVFKDTWVLKKFTKKAVVECVGNDLESSQSTLGDCARRCFGWYGCVAFIVGHSDDHCLLKGRCDVFTANSDATAYVYKD